MNEDFNEARKRIRQKHIHDMPEGEKGEI